MYGQSINNILTSDSTATTSWTTMPTYTITYPTTPAGTDFKFESTKKEISAKLYISYVKSKLNKNQQQKLKRRLAKLEKMVQDSKELNQRHLYENLSTMLAVVIRESEALACGVDTWVLKKDVDKFIHIVKENAIKFDDLEKFPRSIPAMKKVKIKGVQDKKLFDKYHILYTDYTKEILKTNKEKVREKDPIVFGSYSYQPEKLYYITDWVDKFCDLTLEKFVDKMQSDDPEFELNKIPDMNIAMMEEIKREVTERHNRLTNTGRDNFKRLEEEAYIQEAKDKAVEEALKLERARVKVASLPTKEESDKAWKESQKPKGNWFTRLMKFV